MINYTIEVFNFHKNEWITKETARTFDEAFDKAEKEVGKYKDCSEVAILDMQGIIVWSSEYAGRKA